MMQYYFMCQCLVNREEFAILVKIAVIINNETIMYACTEKEKRRERGNKHIGTFGIK